MATKVTSANVSNVSEAEQKAGVYERIFTSPQSKIVVASFTFLAAVLLLAYKDKIVGCWPVAPWPGPPRLIVWPAFLYWFCGLLPLIVGFCQIHASEVKDRRSGQNKNLQIAKIQQELDTLPGGPAFREQFALKADHLQLLLATGLGGRARISDLEQGLLDLLASVAMLASLYGPHGDYNCYSYVMRLAENPTAAERDLVQQLVANKGCDPDQGLLLVVPELAVQANGKRDPRAAPLALIATLPSKTDSLDIEIFAHQVALSSKEALGISDVAGVTAETSGESPYLQAFLATKKAAPWAFGKSFVTLPLRIPAGTHERTSIGVLTVTSDGPLIMGGTDERWQIFRMIMRPYTDGIALLLKAYFSAKAN